jgi:parallel beta-helix repeat protein
VLGTALGLVVAAAAAVSAFAVHTPDAPRPTTADPAPPTPAAAAPPCSRWAGTDGDDAAPGTAAAPLRTVSALAASLEPGERGCLLPGVHTEDVRIDRGGRPGAPITLTSAGERAVLRGRLVVTDTADDVVVSGLLLDGRNPGALPSPTVNGDRVVFEDNEVTNHGTAICFNLGHETFGVAVGTVLRRNDVHDCGRRPTTNYDHGIYVAAARDTLIEGNRIHRNADRGIQLYPDAQRTRITGNVIDRNGTGVIFSGDTDTASSDNTVVDNVITNSTRTNVEAFWEADQGTGNLVERNCLWPPGPRNIAPPVGFVERDNVVADPLYLDDTDGEYGRRAGGPCAAIGPHRDPPP